MIKRYLFFLSIVALSNVKLVSNNNIWFRAFNASAYKKFGLIAFSGVESCEESKKVRFYRYHFYATRL